MRGARFVALVGDAELDEGNIWEAIADPSLHGLGSVMWVVDVNRQSLDRVIPDQKIKKLIEFFDGAGWQVVEAKYGRLMEAACARDGGHVLREFVDGMENERYQSLFAVHGPELRVRFLDQAPADLVEFVSVYDDEELERIVTNLGGHDLDVMLESYRACDAVDDRPSVVFAYTVKGWGLPIAGDPLNHAALLSAEQIAGLRESVGLDTSNEWDRFAPDTPEGMLCDLVGGELINHPPRPRPVVPIPDSTGVLTSRPVSTQETFGRVLTALANTPAVAGSDGDHLAGRQRVDEPRWLDQQDGGVRAAGATRLPRHRPAAALAAVGRRPPRRVGHQRDEPVPRPPRVRSRPRTARAPPAADRHGVRPVRVPRPRRADLRVCTTGPGSSWSARRPA